MFTSMKDGKIIKLNRFAKRYTLYRSSSKYSLITFNFPSELKQPYNSDLNKTSNLNTIPTKEIEECFPLPK